MIGFYCGLYRPLVNSVGFRLLPLRLFSSIKDVDPPYKPLTLTSHCVEWQLIDLYVIHALLRCPGGIVQLGITALLQAVLISYIYLKRTDMKLSADSNCQNHNKPSITATTYILARAYYMVGFTYIEIPRT